MGFRLLRIKPAPSYHSPPRVQQPRPELMYSPDYSPAKPVPEELLEPNLDANGLRMRGKGGTYAYQAPEAIDQAAIRNTVNEEIRERAQSARSKLIFNPNFINKWEKGDPLAHQRLANLGRAAAGKPPLEPLPFPPPPPVKVSRSKPISFNNENNNDAEPVTAPPSAAVPSPNARQPPPAPNRILGKRPRPTRKVKNNRKRKTRRLKNRCHK